MTVTATPAAAARAARFGALRLDGVTRRFGDAVALHRLDLEIRGGEFIALLGPSGCGKSTALNCLAGLLPLSEGSIWIDDRRIDGQAPEQRGFGMVFQSYALFPHLSVRRNVAFGLSVRGVSRAETRKRADAALALVQLGEHADKFPAQLSGGQQQRVAIARAIVLEPQLVLMDEPLSNLDAKLRLEMRTEVRRLHQTLGLTTVYVTHDQEEALSLADRLVVLRDGRVQQIGSGEEVYTQPANAFVAGFMGYRNLFEVEVERSEGDAVTVTGPDLRLRGRNRAELTGGRAVAAIRPEDFTLTDPDGPDTPAGTPDGDANAVQVTVEVSEYRGKDVTVEATTSSGRQVHFRTERRLAPGDPVTLTVPADRVLVFAPESAKSAESAESAVPAPGQAAEPGPDAGSAAERVPPGTDSSPERES